MPLREDLLTPIPGVKTAVNNSADKIAGNPCTASTRRMKTSSGQPPSQPLSRPSTTPIPAPMPTAITPTAMEVRAPAMTRDRRSRPY